MAWLARCTTYNGRTHTHTKTTHSNIVCHFNKAQTKTHLSALATTLNSEMIGTLALVEWAITFGTV